MEFTAAIQHRKPQYRHSGLRVGCVHGIKHETLRRKAPPPKKKATYWWHVFYVAWQMTVFFMIRDLLRKSETRLIFVLAKHASTRTMCAKHHAHKARSQMAPECLVDAAQHDACHVKRINSRTVAIPLSPPVYLPHTVFAVI